MRLPQMEDVGGCRVVLADLQTQLALIAHMHDVWGARDLRVYDYVANPKPTGYRAVHVIALWDRHLVEVQVRTRKQHAWAVTVERLDAMTGHRLKDGDGPERLLEEIRTVGDVLAAEDRGEISAHEARARLRSVLPDDEEQV